jgi:hypothetical protein
MTTGTRAVPLPGMGWRAIASGLAWGCAVLLAAGCAGGARDGFPARHAASAPQTATPAARGVLAARYLAIAQAGNRRLDHDFDALDGRDRDHLSAADADLRDIAATERVFDRRLAGIAFPPQTEMTARLLVIANQARARLTQAAASSMSLPQLHRYLPRLEQANGPVEAAVRLIRSQLGLAPPDTH